MLFDTRVSWSVLILGVLCLLFPFVADLKLPLYDGAIVRAVEHSHALLLLLFAVLSYFFMRPTQLQQGKKQFWIWAVLWWLVLFGRSTSWGRDYFPDVPKIYFRGISVVLMGSVVFMLFSKPLRSEIALKIKTISIPVWAVLLVILGFVISDGIEHHRAYGEIFLRNVEYKDLIEELYEFPLIIGLFLVTLHVMRQDRPVLSE